MGGIKANKQIRAAYKKIEDKTKKKIMLKIGSISAIISAQEQEELKNAGIDFFIGKPFEAQ